jgi:hypothetical protein
MNKLKIFTVLFVSAFAFTSCDALLDQSETDFGAGPVLAQFTSPSSELNIIKTAANAPIDYEFDITYFGGKNVALDKDVTVTIAASSKSVAKQGVEFELPTTTFTIPAGETTATASMKILTAGLVPFDFKDIVLEITDSSESVSDVNTFTLTLKALAADTLAGDYTATDGQYWNSGNFIANYAGNHYTIQAISPGLYKYLGIAYWVNADNSFYFKVDENTGAISILDKDLDGEPITLNGSPIMTGTNNIAFEMVPFVAQSTLKPDGKHEVKLTFGYFRGAGATREFTEVLIRD